MSVVQSEKPAPMLSLRARNILEHVIPRIMSNIKDLSRSDVVDMSTAENWLMRDMLIARIGADVPKLLTSEDLSYANGPGGAKNLLRSICQYINTYFQPHEEVLPSHVATSVGANGVLEAVIYNLCNQDDAILVPAPYWSGFDLVFEVRNSVHGIPVQVPLRQSYSISIVEALEKALQSSSTPVKAVLFSNPNNPLGQCYPRETILEVMRFCERRNLHFIADEIFALSVFPTEKVPQPEPFSSALGIDLEKEGINRERVHVIYSMSKDFGCSGFRLGIFITRNDRLWLATALETHSSVSSLTSVAMGSILSSDEFLRKFFILNRQRLADAYRTMTTFLERRGISYLDTNAGTFVFARLGGKLECGEEEAELELAKQLREHGVSVVPGQNYHCQELGWFRICFALPQERLEEGLRRIDEVLDSRLR